jgi:DNA-binding beta-propeller fold protein YncE
LPAGKLLLAAPSFLNQSPRNRVHALSGGIGHLLAFPKWERFAIIRAVKAKLNRLSLAGGVSTAVTFSLLWILWFTSASRVLAEPSNTILRTLKNKGYGCTIVASPDGRFVYFSNTWGIISVIDAQTNRRGLSQLKTGGLSPVLAISPDSQTLYAAIGEKPYGATSVVDVISTASLSVTAQVPIENGALLGLTPDGKQLWVAYENEISVIDTATMSPATISFPGTPFECVFTPDGTQAYLCYATPGSASFRIALIDTASGAVVNDDVAGAAIRKADSDSEGPVKLALDPVLGELDVEVVTPSNRIVMAINTSDYTAGTIYVPLGEGEVDCMCVTPNGKYLYLAVDNFPDSPLFEVVSIDPASGKILGPPIDGVIPNAIAIRPDGKYAYLMGSENLGRPYTNNVTIVDIGP